MGTGFGALWRPGVYSSRLAGMESGAERIGTGEGTSRALAQGGPQSTVTLKEV